MGPGNDASTLFSRPAPTTQSSAVSQRLDASPESEAPSIPLLQGQVGPGVSEANREAASEEVQIVRGDPTVPSASAPSAQVQTSFAQEQQAPEGSTASAVLIPDSNLRSLIAAALDKPNDAPITYADIATLTWLEANGAGIRDLTGLQAATNLVSLNLEFNQISHFAPLAGLTNLTELHLGLNQISDISPLAGLTELRDMTMDQNRITDISPLVANQGLGSGYAVDITGNPLSAESINTHLPALRARGVLIHYP